MMTRSGVGHARRRGFAFVASMGAVSWAWSEVGFWARFRPGDGPGPWILTWSLYTVVTYLVLRVARRYPVGGTASLLLLGSLYGWLVEGAGAATLYESLPLSVVWTGVAWHAILTVTVGWHALPRALDRGGPRALGWCAAVGLAWGLWAVSWWGAPPDDGVPAATPRPGSFAVFAILVSAVVSVGYGVARATAPGPGDLTGRRGPWIAGIALAGWATLVVFIPIPWAPVVLAAVVTVAWRSLRRLDRHRTREPLGWLPGVPWRRLAPMAAVPGVAVTVYLTGQAMAGPRPGGGLFHAGFVAAVAGLTLAGTAALAWSLWKAATDRDPERRGTRRHAPPA